MTSYMKSSMKKENTVIQQRILGRGAQGQHSGSEDE